MPCERDSVGVKGDCGSMPAMRSWEVDGIVFFVRIYNGDSLSLRG